MTTRSDPAQNWRFVASGGIPAIVCSLSGKRITADEDRFYAVVIRSTRLFDQFLAWIDGGCR